MASLLVKMIRALEESDVLREYTADLLIDLANSSYDSTQSVFSFEEIEYLVRNQRIQAIKSRRARTDCSLIEAKRAIDGLAEVIEKNRGEYNG